MGGAHAPGAPPVPMPMRGVWGMLPQGIFRCSEIASEAIFRQKQQ